MTRSARAVGLGLVLLVGACGDDGAPDRSAPPRTAEVGAPGSGAGSAVPDPTTAVTTPPPETTIAPLTAAHVFPLSPSSAGDYSDGHHDYPATDIFCPPGTDVVAVTAGVVDHVSRVDPWDPAVDDPPTRGGLSVAVVGDDGVRYYGSHLSAVAARIDPGVRVRTGQLLGQSGDSGNAAGTDPHLHFGLSHPTTPDDWAVRRGEVNPYPYLEAWRRGENITPEVG